MKISYTGMAGARALAGWFLLLLLVSDGAAAGSSPRLGGSKKGVTTTLDPDQLSEVVDMATKNIEGRSDLSPAYRRSLVDLVQSARDNASNPKILSKSLKKALALAAEELLQLKDKLHDMYKDELDEHVAELPLLLDGAAHQLREIVDKHLAQDRRLEEDSPLELGLEAEEEKCAHNHENFFFENHHDIRKDHERNYQDIWADLKRHSSHARRAAQITEDIHSGVQGDGRKVHKHVNSILRRLNGRSGAAATPASHEEYHRDLQILNEEKKAQCQLLVDCVERMSLYDMVVYYYSDNIDPDEGVIDPNAVTFDEGYGDKIIGKFNTIKNTLLPQARALINNNGPFGPISGAPQDHCDLLLTEFHHTIERSGNVPVNVVPGSIPEICFAEGTLQYIPLVNITALAGKQVADLVIQEYFSCAWAIHNNPANQNVDAQGNTYQFPFFRPGTQQFVLPFLLNEGWGCTDGTCPRNRHGELVDASPNVMFQSYPLEPATITMATGEFDFKNINSTLCAAQLDQLYNDDYINKGVVRPLKVQCSITAEYSHCCVEEGFDGYESQTSQSPPTCDSSAECTQQLYQCHVRDMNTFNVLDSNCSSFDILHTTGLTQESYLGSDQYKLNATCADGDGCDLPTQYPRLEEGYYDLYDLSFRVIFGESTSAGYLCGLKKANVDQGKKLPGTCCLDTPRDSVDGNGQWGQPFSCEDIDTCKFKAPVLGGSLSKERCDLFEGTFCPNPPDCSELKECVDLYQEYSQNPDGTAKTGSAYFLEYLKLSPTITNETVNDANVCGQAREYFGFDATFTNDDLICQSIIEKRTTRDFSQFDSFFGSSSGGGGGFLPGEDCPAILDAPSRDTFDPIANAAWAAVNAASKAAFNAFAAIVLGLNGLTKCDCVIQGGDVCGLIKNAIILLIKTLQFVLGTVLAISDFTKSELTDVSEPQNQKLFNKLEVVHENMQSLANKIRVESFGVDQAVQSRFTCEDGSLISTCDVFDRVRCQTVGLIKGSGCDGIDNDCQNGSDDCREDTFPPEIDLAQVARKCGRDRHIFSSADAAKNCVTAYMSVADDCSPNVDTNVTATDVTSDPTKHTTSCGHTFSIDVLAEETRCPQNTASKSFLVSVFDGIIHTQDGCKLPEGPDVAPQLDVSSAIVHCSGAKFWKSVEDAKECVRSFSVASDPCRKIALTVEAGGTATPAWNNCSSSNYHEITVSAAIEGCSSLSTQASVSVLVDPNVEGLLGCDFLAGSTIPLLDTSEPVDLCTGRIFPSVEDAEACISQHAIATDAVGECRPIQTLVSTSVNNDLSLSDCSTQYFDALVSVQVQDCLSASNQATVTVLVDPTLAHPSDKLTLGPNLPPLLNIDKAKANCVGKIFQSVEEAEGCVTLYSTATDVSGAGRPFDTTFSSSFNEALSLGEFCGTQFYDVQVQAEISGCSPVASQDSLVLLVDENTNASPCEFSNGPNVSPLLDTTNVKTHCSGKIFASLESAKDCTVKFLNAEDVSNCRSIVTSMTSAVNVEKTLDACETEFIDLTVMSEIQGCSSLKVEEVLTFAVDSNLQTPSCSYSLDPNTPPLLDLTDAIDICTGRIFNSLESAEACVVTFSKASDQSGGCRPVNVNVTSVVDTFLSLQGCGTQYFTATVSAAIGGCANTTIQDSLTLLIDPQAIDSGCHVLTDPNLPPTLEIADVRDSCMGKFFPSIAAAEVCVLDFAKSLDPTNCRTVTTTVDSVLITNGQCGTSYVDITVTSEINDCSALQAAETISLLVDPNVQDPSCDFSLGPNISPKLDLTDAKGQCVGKMFQTIQAAEECIQEFTKTEDVSGGCRPVLLNVTSSSVNAEKTLDTCETEFIDLTVMTEIQGCSALKAEEVLTFAVDSNLQTPSCSYSLDPNTPPLLDLTDAIDICTGRIFNSLESAEACVITFSKASDQSGGCRPVNVNVTSIVDTFLSLPGCGTQHFTATVSAAIGGCANTTVEDSLTLLIDPQAIDSGCHVLTDPNLPPTLEIADVHESCIGKFFPSIAAAEACVLDFAKSLDPTNCRTVTTTVDSDLITNGQCGTSYVDITVTSEINNCSALQVTETISLLVDPNVQDPSCDFSLGPNIPPKLDLTDAKDQCVGKMFQTIQAAEACVREFAKTEDLAGTCRPIATNVTSLVNTALSIEGCGTQYMDIQVESAVSGCSALSSSETLTLQVDNQLQSTSCAYQNGPYLPPAFDSSVAFAECHGKVFRSLEAAINCVEQFSFAEDFAGCRSLVMEASATEISTCNHAITVSASIDGCNGVNANSRPITVIVDSLRPAVSCEFLRAIEVTGAGTYQDPKLSYNASDNCPFPLSVHVKTFADEWEQPAGIGYHYQYQSGNNTKVGAKMASNVCSSTSSSNACISQSEGRSVRTYTTRVTVKDQSGLTNVAECYVEVVPNNEKFDVKPKGKKNGEELEELPSAEVAPKSFLLDSTVVNNYISDDVMM